VTAHLKIALIGSRGIPARYSGFETFYEQFATRLAARGHSVTVYNRSNFIRDVKREYKGVRLVSLPSIPTKHLDTISHTLLSSLHALTQGYDIVYYCTVGNSPLVWLPRMVGSKVLLNVDGADWAREKWGRFARWYQKRCERIACRTASVLIADARAVQRRYRECYGHGTVFVPYGANLTRDEGAEVLDRWGLEAQGYYLYVGRFVPENAIDVLLSAFANVRSRRRLVVVGDAPYASEYKALIREMADRDDRVVLTGYAFGKDYAQLSSHAFAYVQPSGVDGTRPALLDQMGFANCVVVRDSEANSEVVRSYGCLFDRTRLPGSLTETLQRLEDDPEEVRLHRSRVQERIRTYYNWDWITEFYEDLFMAVLRGDAAPDYDRAVESRAEVATRRQADAPPPATQ
jgi:glycosyltransferase involved in cell wall biosynthesis